MLEQLEKRLGDRLCLPGSPGYTDATALTFGAPSQPVAVVQVRSTADVVAGVEAAMDAGVPIAIRGGGHSNASYGAVDDALVLDMRGLADVTIDPDRLVGTAGGGTLAATYTEVAGQHGLATGFGDTPTVGIAGLTLGGGIGFLSRRDGLTVDNLRSAEVVLADGRVVTPDAGSHLDLFWALRGGGGNFGVVTKLELDLKPTATVVGGPMMVVPTPEVIAAAVNGVLDAPDELSAMLNLVKAPPMPMIPESMHGKPALMMFLCWSGAGDEADKVLGQFRELGEPLFDAISERPYPKMLEGPPQSAEAAYPSTSSGFVDAVDASWGAAAIEAIETAVTPIAAVQMRPMGGAIARVAGDATAFAHRDHPVMTMAGAVTYAPGQVPDARAWADRTADSLGFSQTGYVNFMSRGTPDEVAAAYPDATLARLRNVKRKYDPTNVFHLNHNIPPT